MPSSEALGATLTRVFEDQDASRAFYVPVLSCVLSQITERNDVISMDKQSVTIFHALKAPGIGVRAYMDRLLKYSHCSPECFVLALIYLDRVIHRNPGFVISTLNIHRLLVTSLMTAAKFFDDIYYNNGYYARVGGVSNQEMNALELEFLYMINFSLHVTVEEFERYQHELLGHAANSQPCHCSKEEQVRSACQLICEEAFLLDQQMMEEEEEEQQRQLMEMGEEDMAHSVSLMELDTDEGSMDEDEGEGEEDSCVVVSSPDADVVSSSSAAVARHRHSQQQQEQQQLNGVCYNTRRRLRSSGGRSQQQVGGPLRHSQSSGSFVASEEELGRDINRTSSASSVESFTSVDSRNSDVVFNDVLVHARPISSSAPVSRHSSPSIPEEGEMMDATCCQGAAPTPASATAAGFPHTMGAAF